MGNSSLLETGSGQDTSVRSQILEHVPFSLSHSVGSHSLCISLHDRLTEFLFPFLTHPASPLALHSPLWHDSTTAKGSKGLEFVRPWKFSFVTCGEECFCGRQISSPCRLLFAFEEMTQTRLMNRPRLCFVVESFSSDLLLVPMNVREGKVVWDLRDKFW